MRRGRLLILVAIILLLGVAAVFLWMRRQTPGPSGVAATPAALDRQNVVIAAQDISRGAVIPENGVILAPFPADAVVETMITGDVTQVIGRYARQDIARGLPVTTGMITDEAGDLLGTGSTASVAIPPGYTAIAVPMNRLSGVAYALRDGDSVDVIGTMLMVDLDTDFQTILPNNTAALLSPGDTVATGGVQAEPPSSQLVVEELINSLTAQTVSGGAASPVGNATFDETVGQPFYQVPSEAQRPRLVSQTLIQDITVLHVGNFFYTDERGEEVPNSIGAVPATDALASIPQPPDLITLIVTPQDAVTLNYLVYAGAELSLALRSAADSTVATTEAVTLEYLLNTYNIPVPTKLPYGLEPRIDSLLSPAPQDILVQPAPTQ